MRNKALSILLLLFLVFAGAAAADQWIHVKVENTQDEELVTVNLPFSLLNAAVAMIPEEVRHEGEIAIDDLDMDWNELMDLWREIKDAPEATFVTVETRDENVVVRKEGDFLVVRTTEHTEHGAEVNAKLPLSVVDALLSGPEGTFDFQAALSALADHGPGELVTVRDGDETVRVWIDDQNEAD
ncbi:MAG: hypothetical protein GY719_00095 [bacterium]|nr:hypothetical protein [bacterium]